MSFSLSAKVAVRDQGLGWRTTCNRPFVSRTSNSLRDLAADAIAQA
jgi:hypothetical protein